MRLKKKHFILVAVFVILVIGFWLLICFNKRKNGICQTHFKMAFIYLLENDLNQQTNTEKLEQTKKISEEVFNYAGRGFITLDLSYPVVKIKINNQNKDRLLYTDPNNLAIYLKDQGIVKEFYINNPDEFDFISIFTNFKIGAGASEAFHALLQNKVEGIGMGMRWDNSANYGSKGKLLGYNYMGDVNLIFTSEFPEERSYYMIGSLLLQETVHQWGAFIGDQDGSSGDLFLQHASGAHWSPGLNTGYDPLGGGDWQDNGDGTFTLKPHASYWWGGEGINNSLFKEVFSDLTLYLIGAVSKEKVNPILKVNYAGVLIPGTTITSEKKYITIDEIISKHGVRLCR